MKHLIIIAIFALFYSGYTVSSTYKDIEAPFEEHITIADSGFIYYDIDSVPHIIYFDEWDYIFE